MHDQYRFRTFIVTIYKITVTRIAITIAIVLIDLSQSQLLDDVDSKCAKQRPNLYEKCDLDYNFMALWCDRTNLTGLPHPDDPRIRTQTPAYRARSIHLNDSCIIALEPEVLGHYVGLHVFNCDDNELTRLLSKTFSKNRQLQILTLSHNRIATIDDDALDGLEKLQDLALQCNSLETINGRILKELGKLKTLNLSENRLLGIDPNAFSLTRQITELNLSKNSLMRLDPRWINGMRTLQVLNLSGNQLTNPRNRTFWHNPMIVKVDFSSNNMTCIPKNIVKNQKNLTFFNVSGNHLATPRPGWFRSVYRMKDPELLGTSLVKDNEWACDCRAHQYWNFLHGEIQEEKWRKVFDTECSSPPKHQGKMLSSFTNDYFSSCKVGDPQDCEEVFDSVFLTNLNVADVDDEETDVTTKADESAPEKLVEEESTPQLYTISSINEEFVLPVYLIIVITVTILIIPPMILMIIICTKKRKRKRFPHNMSSRLRLNTQLRKKPYSNLSTHHNVINESDKFEESSMIKEKKNSSLSEINKDLLNDDASLPFKHNNVHPNDEEIYQNEAHRVTSGAHRKERFKQREVTQDGHVTSDVVFLGEYLQFEPRK